MKMKKSYVTVIGILLVGVVLLAGCSSQNTGSTTPSTNTPTTSQTSSGTISGNIVIKGSDTEVNTVQALAEAFHSTHPNINISVSGGGSGAGIAAIINGEIDIADASREITPDEMAKAKANGINLGWFIIGRDGITIVVNPSNPVNQLTIDQLGKIYRGEITNWKDVGGPDMPITLYGRQNSSGTYQMLQELALKGDYAPTMRQMNGNSDIANAVAQDKTAIGYIGVGYFNEAQGKVKEVLLGTDGKNFYSSTDLNAIDNKLYPLERSLNQYVKLPLSPAVKEFLAFEISDQGQKIVQDNGFYGVGPSERATSEALLNQ
jgi:phosphate transport system substrate-binding protein